MLATLSPSFGGTPLGMPPPVIPDGETARVLVADDQADVRMALGMLMRDSGVDADGAGSVEEVRRKLESGSYDLLLLDLNYARDTTSGQEGLALLAEVRARDPFLPIVVMTGWGSVEMAVEAMRRGARGFVHKPWDNTTLALAIRREIDDARLARDNERRALRDQADAQAIQRALLPSSLPAVPGCTLAARWTPAAAFGGDGYDVVQLTDTTFAISIADVCGKGLAAALLMSNLQASVRAFASIDPTPASVAAKVNAALVRNDGLRRFVTFFYAVFDTVTRELTFVNAGHNPPMVIGTDGAVQRLATGGMVLGVFGGASFEQASTHLVAGDRLVLFTDGIVEAEDARRHEFGDDRLAAVVVRGRPGAAATLVDDIFAAVTRYAAGPLQDDATVVVMAVA